MRQPALTVSLVLVLSACHTGSGGSPPFFPTPAPPKVIHAISGGIASSAQLAQAVSGPDGRVWFTESNVDRVAAVQTNGAVTEYPLPAGSQPNAITVGPDGNIWAGGSGLVLRITTSGSFTPVPIGGARIGGLTLGSDGNLWFADSGNDAVGKTTTAGSFVEYPAPAGAIPTEIAAGSDGNLWVTDANGSILRVSTTGAMIQYTKGITSGAHPLAIIGAPDTNLYFTEPFFSSTANDRIGKITIGGVITEFGSLLPNTYPNQIALGSDGNLYFTELRTGNIGRVIVSTLSMPVTQTPLGITQGSAIVNGPDNDLWVGGLQTIYQIAY